MNDHNHHDDELLSRLEEYGHVLRDELSTGATSATGATGATVSDGLDSEIAEVVALTPAAPAAPLKRRTGLLAAVAALLLVVVGVSAMLLRSPETTQVDVASESTEVPTDSTEVPVEPSATPPSTATPVPTAAPEATAIATQAPAPSPTSTTAPTSTPAPATTPAPVPPLPTATPTSEPTATVTPTATPVAATPDSFACTSQGNVWQQDECYQVVPAVCGNNLTELPSGQCGDEVARLPGEAGCEAPFVLTDDRGECFRLSPTTGSCAVGIFNSTAAECLEEVAGIAGGTETCPVGSNNVVLDGSECYQIVPFTCSTAGSIPFGSGCRLLGDVSQEVMCPSPDLPMLNGQCSSLDFAVESCPDGGTLISPQCEWRQPSATTSVPITCPTGWYVVGNVDTGLDECGRDEPATLSCPNGGTPSAQAGGCLVAAGAPQTVLVCVATDETIDFAEDCFTNIAGDCGNLDPVPVGNGCKQPVDLAPGGLSCPAGTETRPRSDLSPVTSAEPVCVKVHAADFACSVGSISSDGQTCTETRPLETGGTSQCPTDAVAVGSKCYLPAPMACVQPATALDDGRCGVRVT